MAALVGGHAGVAKLLLEKCGEGAARHAGGAGGGAGDSRLVAKEL